jgi:AraC-like DNA-binding protein
MRETLHFPSQFEGRCWLHTSRATAHFMHCHEELEFNLCTRGRAAYLVKGIRYELTRGSLIWLFPDQEHLLIEQSPDFQMWIVVFRPRLVTRVCREAKVLRQRDPEGQFCVRLREELAGRLGGLYRELLEATADVDRLNAGLGYALLSTWAAQQQAETNPATRRVHPAVDQAARLLHVEPARYRLGALAEEVELSPSRLSRLFAQQMGLTLVSYRQRRCLEKFLDLFARTPERKLMSLALQAGFGSYPQFHRVFVKEMGMPPAQFVRGNAG